MKYSLVELGPGRFRLSGRLDLSNVGEALVTGQNMFDDHDKISINLAAANCASTAGMALLLEWVTWCRAARKQIVYEEASGRLVDLARLNDVEQFLHFSAG